MEVLIGGLSSLFGGAGAATAAAGGAGAAVAASTSIAGIPVAASGLSLASILQGTATALGVISSIGAANADAAQAELAAADADAQQPLETLQGIGRRTSLKKQLGDALGAQDVAYAASGTDLSFGTAAAARKDAFREADLALTTDAGTEMTRHSRLSERAANYRAQAKALRRGGIFSALTAGLSSFQSITDRGF